MAYLTSKEELSDEFSMFGLDVDNTDVLSKFQELCTLHRMNAGEMVTEWVAFTHSRKNTTFEPEMLEHFERERLAKRNQKAPKHVKTEPTPKVYTAEDLPMDVEGAEELYSAYGGKTTTPKTKASNKRQHTPETGPLKRFTGPNRSPAAPFSPASFSPASSTPAKKYNSRTNRGEPVVSSGVKDKVIWQGSGQEVTVSICSVEQTMTKHFKYMFQKLIEKHRVLDNVIDDIADQLKLTNNIEEYAHLSLPTQDDVIVVGRVCCDSNGKLNSKSVLIEGSVETSAGKTIPVDLSQMKEYALFPGQIVAMEGNNSTGQKFIAKKLMEGVCEQLPDMQTSSDHGNMKLSVMVAAGPFSTSDSLSYEPLTDLIQEVQQTKPDVCILMGPFVDCKNQELERGKMSETYQGMFKRIMCQIANSTVNLECQLLVLPSQRDLHHDCVYPQPPYKLDNFNFKHVKFLPDPSTIKINNIMFGLTSTDVLFHIGAEEIAYPPSSGDRLGRLTHHLLSQHSYYPLYPPNEEMCVDYEQYQTYSGLPALPHILVTPSDFKQFIKDIKGCTCLNPGRLTKGLIGGTYAKILVDLKNSKSGKSMAPYITTHILRI